MKSAVLGLPCLLAMCAASAFGQSAQSPTYTPEQRDAMIRQLHDELDQISARLKALEAAGPSTSAPAVVAAAPADATPVAGAPDAAVKADAAQDTATLGFFRGTTINFGVDGYYGYNFNKPLSGTNQLRAYDLSSNSFSINQASVVVERLPVAAPGQRFGGRIDLQFGQATETLGGSTANELNPEVWRDLYQAYGSYLAPVGSGLQLDFGKWSSSLGAEGNYTKDQINYSRSYLFNYLPFYHTGLRATYNVNSKLSADYWLVNGAQQTEDFNGFKSQNFGVVLKPAKSISWTVNYYTGQEQRPINTGLATGQQASTPNGREHIFDTYATWTVTPKLTLVGEADYVVNRVYSTSAPSHVSAGAAYARYQLPRNYALAARTEYLSDRGGLFSGKTQALKEFTATFEHQFEPGFLLRAEYRRDSSNQHYFLSDTQGLLNSAQGTAEVGLVYWWGTKQGAW